MLRNEGRAARAHGNLTIRFAGLGGKDWLFCIKNACPGGRLHILKYWAFPSVYLTQYWLSQLIFLSFAQSHKYCIFFSFFFFSPFFLKWKLFYKAKISLDSVIFLEGKLTAVQQKWHWVILEQMNSWWFKCPSGTRIPTFWLMSLSWAKII